MFDDVEPVCSKGVDYDFMFKFILIGNSAVGKTSFLSRYVDDRFSASFISTVGIDFKIKTITIDNKIIKLQIWVSLL